MSNEQIHAYNADAEKRMSFVLYAQRIKVERLIAEIEALKQRVGTRPLTTDAIGVKSNREPKKEHSEQCAGLPRRFPKMWQATPHSNSTDWEFKYWRSLSEEDQRHERVRVK